MLRRVRGKLYGRDVSGKNLSCNKAYFKCISLPSKPKLGGRVIHIHEADLESRAFCKLLVTYNQHQMCLCMPGL